MNVLTENYHIKADDKRVIAFSTARIPFVNLTAWHKEFRSHIRQALSSLDAQPQDALCAAYGSTKENDYIDAENALFYNIGTAYFKTCARYALAFRSLSAADTVHRLAGKGPFRHYYCYEIKPQAEDKPAATFAAWEDVRIAPLKGSHKPYEYWLALRSSLSGITLFSQNDVMGGFGLEICIDSPDSAPLNLANPLKPLLDGLICAFNRMPASADAEKLALISQRLGCPVDLLLDTRLTPLGEAHFVRPYRNNVFWNPQDHRCRQARLRIRYGRARWQLSGKLFEIA